MNDLYCFENLCDYANIKAEEESELFREGLMLRRQKYVVKLRRFLKQLEPVDRLRHATFSKLSQASNCFEKVCGSANEKAEGIFRKSYPKR